MGYVVPFMNGKGGTGKSVLARAYAVEAARAGASVLIADLDDVQRTSKHWADHRKANGLKPEIRVEVATPRLAYDMADRSDVLVIDAPGWTDRESLKMAHWSTFCVIPSRANRMDDLSETVRLLHALKRRRHRGLALRRGAERAAGGNGRRRMTKTRRAYLAEVGFKALPGFVRDLKGYEIALLEGKAITETGEKALNDEAFVLVNGIAGAVLEAGKKLIREAEAINPKRRNASATKEGAGDDEEQFREACESSRCSRGRRCPTRAQARRRLWRRPRCRRAQRREGPAGRCNSRRSFRPNSSTGSR